MNRVKLMIFWCLKQTGGCDKFHFFIHHTIDFVWIIFLLNSMFNKILLIKILLKILNSRSNERDFHFGCQFAPVAPCQSASVIVRVRACVRPCDGILFMKWDGLMSVGDTVTFWLIRIVAICETLKFWPEFDPVWPDSRMIAYYYFNCAWPSLIYNFECLTFKFSFFLSFPGYHFAFELFCIQRCWCN